jgi:2-succinyl-5-enolpyruvyl-6-hydroxy-3-cyclohexene-1-carboxylate synthase
MARAILDELHRGGVRLVVISPGSRSTALTLAADEHEGLETVVALDERSGGFHALGRAKASGEPAAVICTSGTAAANYYPAVIEAEMSLTPLVVLTADRPAELHGIGANQTIDQSELYGDHTRFFAHVEAPSGHEARHDFWRATAADAVNEARGARGKPGAAQLNVAFREPTVPVVDDGRIKAVAYDFSIEGREGNRPWVDAARDDPQPVPIEIPPTARGLVVAGEGEYDRARVMKAAVALGWPVLATAQSGLRGQAVISAYHHILAGDVDDLTPDVVFVIGAVGPSARLERFIESAGLAYRIDTRGRVLDPSRSATEGMRSGDPAATLEAQRVERAPEGWTSLWSEAQRRVRDALTDEMARRSLDGPSVAAALNHVQWDRLVVASSLPIRDVDAQLSISGDVISNRGASGIDGFVSTALGAASAGGTTLALAGDLSLLHDSNGFLIDVERDLVMIVIDNGGGGLFDGLPQAAHAPSFERLFVAPHGRDFADLARLHGLEFVDVSTEDQLVGEATNRLASGGLHLIRVGVDRAHDLATRRLLDQAGRAALASLQA